jgi:hypothetical protein
MPTRIGLLLHVVSSQPSFSSRVCILNRGSIPRVNNEEVGVIALSRHSSVQNSDMRNLRFSNRRGECRERRIVVVLYLVVIAEPVDQKIM